MNLSIGRFEKSEIYSMKKLEVSFALLFVNSICVWICLIVCCTLGEICLYFVQILYDLYVSNNVNNNKSQNKRALGIITNTTFYKSTTTYGEFQSFLMNKIVITHTIAMKREEQ